VSALDLSDVIDPARSSAGQVWRTPKTFGPLLVAFIVLAEFRLEHLITRWASACERGIKTKKARPTANNSQFSFCYVHSRYYLFNILYALPGEHPT